MFDTRILNSTPYIKLPITSYPISSEKNKMVERFAKVNEQEIRELLDNTTPKIPCLSIYNKTIIPFALVVYDLIYSASSAMSSCTTRARGITVGYI